MRLPACGGSGLPPLLAFPLRQPGGVLGGGPGWLRRDGNGLAGGISCALIDNLRFMTWELNQKDRISSGPSETNLYDS
jgi:hypothetical protein